MWAGQTLYSLSVRYQEEDSENPFCFSMILGSYVVPSVFKTIHIYHLVAILTITL